MPHHNRLAILVGGGPAPGINSVIAAATIRARLEGLDVVGIRDGFEWLMQGDVNHVSPLTIESVSRIHFRGGSYLGIARANPTTDRALLDNTVNALLRLKTTVIGMKLFETVEEMQAIPRIRRPKTVHTTDQIVSMASRLGWTMGMHIRGSVRSKATNGSSDGLHTSYLHKSCSLRKNCTTF